MGIEGITLVDSPGSFRSRDAFFGNDRQEHQSAKKKRGPPTKAARYCFGQPNTLMSSLLATDVFRKLDFQLKLKTSRCFV